ncbi:IMP cyclohydrolase-like protein [Kribbella sp. VKM Ac-2569]|uniref:IMP cyclohydrolase n=1 Tax=Kribbella sp. VKM Ac-2569 TaxID=2512220 RepID=UPI00102B6189|nr:IMP cyclohydrolase [Kribbella sp. VKM Ac-2569]RZT27224.1 IMP cyclohydrolase-like protein [Kribbella sp. VKM Ac-2569]
MNLIESVEYPGRGLAIGRDVNGVPFFTYWLTGRSPASQSRELVVHDREIIVRDTSGGPVDDLRHYTAATRGDDWVIVGNGTQVSELTAARDQQPDLQLALRRLTYEPDPPIRTPRITAGATITGNELTDAVIGSARAYDDAPELTEHPSLYAARIAPATAVTTTTYSGTTDHVITNGRPETIAIPFTWSESTDLIWRALQPALRVAAITVRLNEPTFTDAVLQTRASA